MILALGVLAFRAIRGVSRAFGNVGDGVKPKTEFQAGIGLAFYLVAFACFIVLLVIALSLAIVALFSLLVALVTAWLARRAEVAADALTARAGSGPALRHALRWLRDFDGPDRPVLLRALGLFSTHVPPAKRLARLRAAQV